MPILVTGRPPAAPTPQGATSKPSLGTLDKLPTELLFDQVLPHAAGGRSFYTRLAATSRGGRAAARAVAVYVLRQQALELGHAASRAADPAHAPTAAFQARFTEADTKRATHYLRVLSGAAPMQRAQHLVRRRPEEALALFADVSARWPDTPGIASSMAEAYTTQGTTRLRAQQYDAAQQSFRQALLRAPNMLEAVIGLGEALHQAGDDANALPWLRRAARGLPRSFACALSLGEALLTLGDASAAEATFRAAPKPFSGRRCEYLLGLGASLQQRGELDAAEAIYTEGADLTRRWAMFPYLRAELLRLQDRWREADEAFSEAGKRIAHTPSHRWMLSQPRTLALEAGLAPAICLGQGLARRALGQHRAAIDCLLCAIAGGQDVAPAHLALGACYEALAEPGAAAVAYRRALVLQPGAPEAQFGLLRVEAASTPDAAPATAGAAPEGWATFIFGPADA